MTGLSDSQLAIRATGIGASEVGAICGLSYYGDVGLDGQRIGGPHSVYLRKRGLVLPSESTVATRLGHALERAIEPEYTWATRCAEHPNGVTLAPLLDANDEPLTMRHPDYPWALASIDRVRVTDLIPVEIKCVTGKRSHYSDGDPCDWCGRSAAMHWGYNESSVPDDVLAQVQWQMFVCGAPWAHVCRFWAGNYGPEFKIHTVKRSDEIVRFLFEKVRQFWFDHVVAGMPPEPDASEDSELCERLHARSVLRGLEKAPLGTEVHAANYFDGDRMIREGTLKKAEAANYLRRIVGEAEGVEGLGYMITNRARKDGVRVLKAKET
jgi:putative phage-type endonuclease